MRMWVRRRGEDLTSFFRRCCGGWPLTEEHSREPKVPREFSSRQGEQRKVPREVSPKQEGKRGADYYIMVSLRAKLRKAVAEQRGERPRKLRGTERPTKERGRPPKGVEAEQNGNVLQTYDDGLPSRQPQKCDSGERRKRSTVDKSITRILDKVFCHIGQRNSVDRRLKSIGRRDCAETTCLNRAAETRPDEQHTGRNTVDIRQENIGRYDMLAYLNRVAKTKPEELEQGWSSVSLAACLSVGPADIYFSCTRCCYEWPAERRFLACPMCGWKSATAKAKGLHSCRGGRGG
jgi:hypothetical protein